MAVQSASKTRQKTELKEPKKYNVIMHNDDFTTMDFVVEILETVFHKAEAEANRLMLLVHRTGSAVVGTYSYDIAATKIRVCTEKAKAAGFPFRVTMKEV